MKRIKWLIPVMLLVCIVYLAVKLPAQELRIIAMTQDTDYDLVGATDLWYLAPLRTGTKYSATIKFMAVENTSPTLFARCGTGQYVWLGCNELTGRCEFYAAGHFLHIRLNLKAVETDLKLEDGTPFDRTRYSLRPVFDIENQTEERR